ncbi:unnamed protein product, partial [Brenthis ino]
MKVYLGRREGGGSLKDTRFVSLGLDKNGPLSVTSRVDARSCDVESGIKVAVGSAAREQVRRGVPAALRLPYRLPKHEIEALKNCAERLGYALRIGARLSYIQISQQAARVTPTNAIIDSRLV